MNAHDFYNTGVNEGFRPISTQWGETVIRELLGRNISGKDNYIDVARKKGYHLEFRCSTTVGGNPWQINLVEVFMTGPGIEQPLAIGKAERPGGGSFAEPLRRLAEVVRAQLTLICT